MATSQRIITERRPEIAPHGHLSPVMRRRKAQAVARHEIRRKLPHGLATAAGEIGGFPA